MTRNSYAELPVNDLLPADYNPNRMPEHQFAQLVDEVRRQGRVLKPVVVRVDEDGSHVIVDGEHNWRAADAAGLATVPVELIEADDFEARRQTYRRNLVGENNKVMLGRMYDEMLAMGGPMQQSGDGISNRELGEQLGISEGTIRNMLLYAKLADMCAEHEGAPDEDAIAAMSIREVRKLIAHMEGADADEDGVVDETPASEAAAEPSDLRKLKSAWGKACVASRSAFVEWADLRSIAPDTFNGHASEDTTRNCYEAEQAAEPTVTQPELPPSLPYGITGSELFAMCKANGITMTAFAKPLGYTATRLSRLVDGVGEPIDFDVVQAIRKLQEPPPPAPAAGPVAPKSGSGRSPNPPVKFIPEIEVLLAKGYSLTEISLGMGGAKNLASLIRGGHRAFTGKLPAKLKAFAESVGVVVEPDAAA